MDRDKFIEKYEDDLKSWIKLNIYTEGEASISIKDISIVEVSDYTLTFKIISDVYVDSDFIVSIGESGILAIAKAGGLDGEKANKFFEEVTSNYENAGDSIDVEPDSLEGPLEFYAYIDLTPEDEGIFTSLYFDDEDILPEDKDFKVGNFDFVDRGVKELIDKKLNKSAKDSIDIGIANNGKNNFGINRCLYENETYVTTEDDTRMFYI